ncbi:hypothetical protein [Pseudofrankia sp. BMG5.37]|uniref:hypothetical protein n=1 Tax=Pseudofrankia sp. BMG5.37 TaxID=3050035 RepID=UPI002894FFD6|nr:hypothetical protein [Pseudofrankia sp. BMG5.37]MDT3444337.1 hypothetical protein [Pseudofrankia sp. BMG5.37]
MTDPDQHADDLATAVTTTASPSPAPAGNGRPSLPNAAAITTAGTMIWVGLLWLAIAAVFGIVLGIVAGAGSTDHSLWQHGFSGWQRFVPLAAGLSMTSTFAPMLVGNGVTRARVASAATVTLVVIAVAGGLFIALGYGLEGLAFHTLGWRHELSGGRRLSGGGGLVRVGAAYAALFACYFASGWLIGVARGVLGREAFVPLVVPALLPAAVAELVLRRGVTGPPLAGRLGLDSLPQPPLTLGLLAALAATALAALLAHVASRHITLPI